MARLTKTERSTGLKLRHLMHERVLRLCAVRQLHMENACQGLPADACRFSRLVHLHTTTTTAFTTNNHNNNSNNDSSINNNTHSGDDHYHRITLDWRHRLLVAFTPCDDWTWLLKEGADVKDHRESSRMHTHPTSKPSPSHSHNNTTNPTHTATSHAVFAMDIEGVKKKRSFRVIQEIESAAGKPAANHRATATAQKRP